MTDTIVFILTYVLFYAIGFALMTWAQTRWRK